MTSTTNRRRTAAGLLLVSLLTLLLGAPVAAAADGVGLGGRTDDLKVTLWGLGVLMFFAILVVVLSFIQGRLETRKERARADIERFKRD
jgi:hypothetical protein